jgi:DNA-binding NarL/FixJ family response regulator
MVALAQNGSHWRPIDEMKPGRASDHLSTAADAKPTPEPVAVAAPVSAERRPGTGPIVVIDRRRLLSQCIQASLRLADPHSAFVTCASLDEWQADPRRDEAGLVVLCLSGAASAEAEAIEIRKTLSQLRSFDAAASLAVMSDGESPDRIVQALNAGARGYIPTSTSLEIAVHAFQLVRAGGIYVPATIVSAVAADPQAGKTASVPGAELFSPRQLRVARALRMGVPNKIIAYELNMCESTVKVHVRNIMKKLRAKNRTEVAFLTNKLFAHEDQDTTVLLERPAPNGSRGSHRP